MAVFNYNNIKISGISCVVPKNIIKTDTYKEVFGDEEVEKFMQMTGITQPEEPKSFKPLLIWLQLLLDIY